MVCLPLMRVSLSQRILFECRRVESVLSAPPLLCSPPSGIPVTPSRVIFLNPPFISGSFLTPSPFVSATVVMLVCSKRLLVFSAQSYTHPCPFISSDYPPYRRCCCYLCQRSSESIADNVFNLSVPPVCNNAPYFFSFLNITPSQRFSSLSPPPPSCRDA